MTLENTAELDTRLLTLAEMAERLHISTRTLRNDVAQRGIPFYPVGKKGMLFDPLEVKAYLRTRVEPESRSNVRLFPVAKKKRGKVVSQKFAEAR